MLEQEADNGFVKVELERQKLRNLTPDTKCLDGSDPGYYMQKVPGSYDYIIVFEEHLPCVEEGKSLKRCVKGVKNKETFASSVAWPSLISYNQNFMAEKRYQNYNKVVIKSCDGALGYGYRVETVRVKSDGEQIQKKQQQQSEKETQENQKQQIQNRENFIFGDQANETHSLYFKGYTNTLSILKDLNIDYKHVSNIYAIGGTSMLLWAEYLNERLSQVQKKNKLKLIVDNQLTYDLDIQNFDFPKQNKHPFKLQYEIEEGHDGEINFDDGELMQNLNDGEELLFFDPLSEQKEYEQQISVFQKRFQSLFDFAFQKYKGNEACLSKYQQQFGYLCLIGENLVKSYEKTPIFLVQSFYNFYNFAVNLIPKYNDINEDEYYYNMEGPNQIPEEQFVKLQHRNMLFFEKIISEVKQNNQYSGVFASLQHNKEWSVLFELNYDYKEMFSAEGFTVRDALMHWIQYIAEQQQFEITPNRQEKPHLKHNFVDQFDYENFKIKLLQLLQKGQKDYEQKNGKNIDYFNDVSLSELQKKDQKNYNNNNFNQRFHRKNYQKHIHNPFIHLQGGITDN